MTLRTFSSAFSTIGQVSRAGATIDWEDAGDALASNNTYATAAIGAAEETHYLQATGLVSKPRGGSRRLVEVRFRLEHQAPVLEISDLAVHAVVGGSIVDAINYAASYWPPNDLVREYTVAGSDLATLGITLDAMRQEDFGFAIAALGGELSDTAMVDCMSIEYDAVTETEEDEMDVMTHVMAGGLKPLRINPGTNESCSEAIPAVSSSAALFASAPTGTVAVSLTVLDQDLVIRWNDPSQVQAATTSAGGGNRYLAGGTYWLPVTRNYLLAARAIQAAATCVGTIGYWGKA